MALTDQHIGITSRLFVAGGDPMDKVFVSAGAFDRLCAERFELLGEHYPMCGTEGYRCKLRRQQENIMERATDIVAAMEQAPRYECHKFVRARLIKRVLVTSDGIVAEFAEGDSCVLPAAFYAKHAPYGGGYLVRYEDGYTSFSPAGPFETGYNAAPESA